MEIKSKFTNANAWFWIFSKKLQITPKNSFFILFGRAVKGFFWKVFITFTKEDRFSWRRKPPGNVFLDQFKEQNVPKKMICLVLKSELR